MSSQFSAHVPPLRQGFDWQQPFRHLPFSWKQTRTAIKLKLKFPWIELGVVFLFLSFKKWVLQRKNFQRNFSFHTRRIFRSDSSQPWIMINGLPVNFDLIIYIFQLWKSLRNFIKKPLYKKKNLPSRRFAVHDTKEFQVFSLASRWLHQCPCPEAHIFFHWIETQCSRSV